LEDPGTKVSCSSKLNWIPVNLWWFTPLDLQPDFFVAGDQLQPQTNQVEMEKQINN